MNKRHSNITLYSVLLSGFLIILAMSACCGRTGSVHYLPGDQKTYKADGVSFTMIYVPGKKFFKGTDDSDMASVDNAFWIGETEVTYELWKMVWTWAVTHQGYNFANPGIMGSNGRGSSGQPVTTLNWRDAIVWCNAVTEWLNAKTGSRFTCVYRSGRIPIRDARGNNGLVCDSVVPDNKAAGFRLFTNNEWELSARFRKDIDNDGDICDPDEYYPGNYASGAAASIKDSAETTRVAVYHSGGPAIVKSKKPDALGLFDMSGNVDEWCFDIFPGQGQAVRTTRGGSWLTSADFQQLGLVVRHDVHCEFFLIGLRLLRSNVP